MKIYAFILSTLVIVSSANARIIFVDGDAPGPVHDGTSWTTAYIDLQDGIDDTFAFAGDIIHVAEGRYTPDRKSGDRLASYQLRSSSELWGGFAGFGEPDPDLQDVVVYETILSGDLFGNDDGSQSSIVENSYHVVTSGPSCVVFRGVVIEGGNANLNDGVNNNGAGVLNVDNNSGGLRFANCTFRNNTATSRGGAFYSFNSNPQLEKCTFSDNSASNGGAVYIVNPVFYIVDGCLLSSNSASTSGGAIFLGNGQGIISNSLFTDNHSLGTSFQPGGGAIFIFREAPLVDIINCTFTNNSASSVGGALHVEGFGDEDFVGWEIHNSIFWNNSDKHGVSEDAQIFRKFVTPPFLRHCTVQSWTGAWGGQFNNGLDPQFIDSFGRLSSSSPCIDSGDSDLVLAAFVPNGSDISFFDSDLDGNPRFVDNPFIADTGMGTFPIVDRGAFERQGGGCATNDCDGDGIVNTSDNCPDISNPGQENQDGDSFGDVCDDDADGDGVLDVDDVCIFTPLGITVDPNGTTVSDLDGDCDVDLRDYSIMQLELTGPGH